MRGRRTMLEQAFQVLGGFENRLSLSAHTGSRPRLLGFVATPSPEWLTGQPGDPGEDLLQRGLVRTDERGRVGDRCERIQ
jgi:hypothetical protein